MLIQEYIANRVENQSGVTIQLLMEALKAKSDLILISKTISANKTISKLLSTWLIEMTNHSTTEKRNYCNERPKFTATFIYQEQLTIEKYNKLISNGADNTLGYPTVINCAEWTNYVKTPCFTRQKYLNRISPLTPSSRHPTIKFTPPYGLTFASFAGDVGVIDKKTKTHTIDAGHMNGYLIIPRIVYHLSTKLQKSVTHDCLGQDKEVKLIQFLTQFGYATRKSPTAQLHATHTHYCSGVNETKYIQGCDSIHHNIPVKLFLALLYNACFTFQHNKTTNLLKSALDFFNLGTTVDDDTFMTTISKSTNSAVISKQEFHAIINNFEFTQFFTLHSFVYSWALLVCIKYYLN
jgi:hypothetical protein